MRTPASLTWDPVAKVPNPYEMGNVTVYTDTFVVNRDQASVKIVITTRPSTSDSDTKTPARILFRLLFRVCDIVRLLLGGLYRRSSS